ncbi:hypothetical protein OIV83_005280 [Microbotryomycetes sp. JL201]|nr:hypothetical protein OIV83_005280 [Microbotryomycetes sp. JL201]
MPDPHHHIALYRRTAGLLVSAGCIHALFPTFFIMEGQVRSATALGLDLVADQAIRLAIDTHAHTILGSMDVAGQEFANLVHFARPYLDHVRVALDAALQNTSFDGSKKLHRLEQSIRFGPNVDHDPVVFMQMFFKTFDHYMAWFQPLVHLPITAFQVSRLDSSSKKQLSTSLAYIPA